MKERPILFGAPMVRAILEGQKTQTRRIVKPLPPAGHIFAGWCAASTCRADEGKAVWYADAGHFLRDAHRVRYPHGRPGDRLWVREAHKIFHAHGQHRDDGVRWGPWSGLPTKLSPDGTEIAYFREGFDRSDSIYWRPSIHMPRWASRILLEITGVRVERLQNISEADAVAEGCRADWRRSPDTPMGPGEVDGHSARCDFADLWEELNGAGSWSANPWVWVIEFKRLPGAEQGA